MAASLQGKPQREQEQMRLAYQFWGIPFNAKKAIEEAEVAERLGAFLDGNRGSWSDGPETSCKHEFRPLAVSARSGQSKGLAGFYGEGGAYVAVSSPSLFRL